MVQIDLPPEFAYSIFVATLSVFVLFWKGFKVGRMRAKENVKYPIFYSSANGGDNVFNCYQRAHQNTLEGYPQFLMLMFTGAIHYPVASAAGGLVWVVARIIYALGYYTGKPRNRMRGLPLSHLVYVVLISCSLCSALVILHGADAAGMRVVLPLVLVVYLGLAVATIRPTKALYKTIASQATGYGQETPKNS